MKSVRRLWPWLVVVIGIGLTAASVWWVRSDVEEMLSTAAFGLVSVAFVAVGALILTKRPSEPIGWVMLALIVEPIGVVAFYYIGIAENETLRDIATWVAAWLAPPIPNLLLPLLFLLFPNGQLISRRWRPVLWLAIGLLVAIPVASALAPHPMTLDESGVQNPLVLPGGLGDLFQRGQEAGWVLTFLAVAMSAASVVVRFRVSTGIERQQMKWFALGAGVLGVAVLAGIGNEVLVQMGVVTEDTDPFVVSNGLLLAAIGMVAVSIGLAVLRYRLYEVDRIVSRTITYALVVGTLVAIYGALVLGVQALLPETQESDIAVAASTLMAAALFAPLRRRIQDRVDRRFDRSRYDALRVIETFAARLRSEMSLVNLAGELGTVVEQTMRPATVSMWLPEGLRR